MSDSEHDRESSASSPHENGQVSEDEEDAEPVASEGLESEMDDLFGDDAGSGDEAPQQKLRELDDPDLDSGDDEGRKDRVRGGSAESEPVQYREDFTAQFDSHMHHEPDPSDGELYLLKVPTFLSIEGQGYNPRTFEPPTAEHHSKLPPSSLFNAYDTAMTTIRWRHSPSDPSKLQSNARILRWSDGSLTLQLAADPTSQYEIKGKPLAPPQKNPPKPVPVTPVLPRRTLGAQAQANGYDASQDTFTYLAAAYSASYLIRSVGKLTTSLQVLPPLNKPDDAKLQAIMARTNRVPSIASEGTNFAHIMENPELAKKKAEQAEREKLRAQRRMEAQVAREREKQGRGLGRSGGTAGGRLGLSVGGLEDEGGPGRTRNRQKPRRSRPGRDEYSEEEEEVYGRRGGPQDKYDLEDDFLVDDEEEEEVDEDAEGEEEDDLDVMAEKSVQPKRGRSDTAGDTMVSPHSRNKRRRVVDDEDDDE